MTNQEAFEAARAGDWIAESFTRSGDVFIISGKSTGYSSFADCLSNGDSVFYSAFDEADNREAGLAVWDASAKTLTPVEIHASLVGGAFIKGDPDAVQFTSGGTITGTLNATAFNTIWGHVFEKGNPHETEADQIDQSNDKLGDTVQDALNKIAAYVVQLDPDGNSDIDWGDLDGLKDLLDSKADQTDLEQEILDRIAGDAALQAQIDAIDPDGDSDVDWSDIENKPTEFPPSAHQQGWDTITGKPADYPPSSHGHEIDDVNGLQDALDAAGGTPAWDDVTGKPSEYPPEAHTHEQSEVDGLEDRLTSIEGSISSGGGFVEAPNDGKLYGRQSEAWAEVVVPDAADPDWSDVQNKPTEFPPSAHGHEIAEINGLGDALTDAGAPTAWGDVTGKPTEFPPENHNHVVADITDFDPSDYQPVGDYQPAGDYVTEAPDDGKQYVRESEAWAEVSIPEAGAAVQIGAAFDGTPSEGDQWLETPAGEEAVMWIYDGDKWLQSPAGKDGQNGADGQGGGESLWKDEGSNTISYSGTVPMSQPDSGDYAVSIGYNAGADTQGSGAVAIGGAAGNLTQGNQAIAIGASAGELNQGAGSISIGHSAGQSNQGANGIIISSSGAAENSGNPNHIYIASASDKYLLYDGSSAWYFAGGPVNGINGFRQNGAPVIDAKGLISTLTTLRNATKDETTLEGMRDALADAIGGLIEGFEHEIATMPAGDEL